MEMSASQNSGRDRIERKWGMEKTITCRLGRPTLSRPMLMPLGFDILTSLAESFHLLAAFLHLLAVYQATEEVSLPVMAGMYCRSDACSLRPSIGVGGPPIMTVHSALQCQCWYWLLEECLLSLSAAISSLLELSMPHAVVGESLRA